MLKTKLMKAFTTATAVACLFMAGITVEASTNVRMKQVEITVAGDNKCFILAKDGEDIVFSAPKDDKRMYVSATSLNIRKTPDKKHKPIKTTKIGRAVHVLGSDSSTGWTMIELDECETEYAYGFVKTKYLSDNNPLVQLGEFKLTAYCPCYECSGKWGNKTYTEVTCEEGRTVAADPSIFNMGDRVVINGNVYTVEDIGGAVRGNIIDIYMNEHSDTERFGVKYRNIYIIKD